jgi:hypothetical protein
VAYASADARQQLQDVLATATDRIGHALAALTEAYEQLDERTAERLEQELFRPVQGAYGRARRTHTSFAERHGLERREFAAPAAPPPGLGVRGLIERAVEDVEEADSMLATLQDSLLPVEVGDRELREGMGEVRGELDHVRSHARELVRTFGR